MKTFVSEWELYSVVSSKADWNFSLSWETEFSAHMTEWQWQNIHFCGASSHSAEGWGSTVNVYLHIFATKIK